MNLTKTKAMFLDGKISKKDYIEQMYHLHEFLFEYTNFIQNTDVASIEITDGTIIMTSRTTGIKMICDINDWRSIPLEILNFGNYEKDEHDIIMKLIENTYTIFDIGANIGWYTINIAKVFKRVNIFSFEPIPMTFDQLKKNINLNNIDNVSLQNFGFSDKTGEIIFFYDPEYSVNASITNLSGRKDIKTVKCKVKRLDDYVRETKVHVDFIKCDVEGAELFVFKGGIETIQEQKPIVFTEMLRKWSAKFNYHPNQIIEMFESIGYRCFSIHENKLKPFLRMDENTIETNFYFLHTKKHKTKIARLG